MDQHLLWNKVNKLIAYQKDLDAFLFQQKHIIADLILRVQYLEFKANVTEEEFNVYKKEFLAKHEEHKANTSNDGFQPEASRPNVSDGVNS